MYLNGLAPIVPVLKRDKSSVRICGDFRLTVNPVSKLDAYPIPKVDDLFAMLKKGKLYSKIDLSQAYQQLPLDKESQKFVVINTPKGLFRYTRLPFGISSAPGIFQRVIETILQGVSNVAVYLDDILITGDTEESHLSTLEEVFIRLQKAGLRMKNRKCELMQPSVTYLGHRIDEKGLHPLTDKLEAIRKAPAPTSVQELKSYLGLLTYYGKFFPNMSATLFPLYRLLRKNSPWVWQKEQQKAFQESKAWLTSFQFLVHFDSTLPIVLACDASAYGIGAVLSHRMPDGSERPIGYASRTLTSSECNYSQLEKEGLSCIFGVKKFNAFLLGHPFELVTDHKPLLSLLSGSRPTNPQASARIRRWSLFMSSYEYVLSFRNTTSHSNADALSRLPVTEDTPEADPPPELVLLLEHLDESPVSSRDIATWTRRDPLLSRVLEYIRNGWPSEGTGNVDLNQYSAKKTELSAHSDCILWGCRVLIPEQGRQAILMELHEGHPGMSRMKSLARMYVWWPGLDADIEKSVRLCQACQVVQSLPPHVPLNPWKWPSRSWARLHLDFAGPLENRMFLVLIDAYSKWIETFPTHGSTSTTVIQHLRTVFARFGLPETIVTDNGSCFTSEEFEGFLKANGIRHVTSAPYHPASNGLAERSVQIIKRGLKKVTEGDIHSRLSKILFSYRITPQGTTGVSPSELLNGRKLRSRLDLVIPDLRQGVESKQGNQKQHYDRRTKSRVFEVGSRVFALNHGQGDKWIQGTVTESTPPMYVVQWNDGRVKRCHANQLRPSIDQEMETGNDTPEVDNQLVTFTPPSSTGATSAEIVNPSSSGVRLSNSHDLSSHDLSSDNNRYPSRNRVPPDRYTPRWN